MTKYRSLFALMSLCGTIWAASVSANNGIQRYEQDVTIPAFYIACLGETVRFEINVLGSYHLFETPSGKFHLLDRWELTYMFTGNDSGRTWYARSVSPYQQNIGPGETLQWTANVHAKPLTGDGPRFKIHETFKSTVNANGELIVDRYSADGVDPSEVWQCIGKK